MFNMIPPDTPGSVEDEPEFEDLGFSEHDAVIMNSKRPWDFVKIFGFGSLVILVAVIISFSWNLRSFEVRAEERVLESFSEIEADAPVATVSQSVSLFAKWRQAVSSAEGMDPGSRRAPAIDEARVSSGVALWDRALQHLSRPEMLRIEEQASMTNLVLHMHDSPGVPIGREAEVAQGEAFRNMVLDRGIRTISDLGSEGAPSSSLYSAALLAQHLERIAPPDLASDLRETTRSLNRRARAHELGAGDMSSLPDLLGESGEAQVPGQQGERERLVEMLGATFGSEDVGVSLAVTGEQSDVMVVQGEFPSDVLRQFFDDTPELLARLARTGFVRIEFRGTDGTAASDLSQASGGARTPGL
jgi:hypothetical protein